MTPPSETSPNPRLSAVVVIPQDFAIARRSIRHLQRQTIAASIELLLVCPARAPLQVDEDALSGFHSVHWLEVGPIDNVDVFSAPGLRAARAPVVAVIEDHAYPEPTWGERVLAAHEGPWAAVGPAYVNANPHSMFSWSNLLSNYGPYCRDHGEGAPIATLPAHNIAYKVDALRPFFDRLEQLLGRDGSLHGELQRSGHQLYFAPDAHVAHANPSALSSSILIRFRGGRMFGAGRARRGSWPWWRRVAYIGGLPLIPFMHLPGILANAKAAGRQRELYGALPTLALGLGVSAIGEAWGYAFGAGDVEQKLAGMEFDRLRQLTRRDQRELGADGC